MQHHDDGFPGHSTPSSHTVKDQALDAYYADDFKCDACVPEGKVSSAVHRCLDCQKGVCEVSKQTQTKGEGSPEHQIINLEEIHGGKYRDQTSQLETVHCETHPKETVTAFSDPVCQIGVDFSHKDPHTHSSIPMAAKGRFESLRRQSSTIDETLAQCDQTIAVLDQSHNYLKSKKEEVETIINSHCESLVQLIRKQQHSLLAEVQQEFTEGQRLLDEKKVKVKEIQQQVSLSKTIASNILERGTETEVMKFERQISQNSEQLQEERSITDALPKEPLFCLFTPNKNLLKEFAQAKVAIGTLIKPNEIVRCPPKVRQPVLLIKEFNTKTTSDKGVSLIAGVAITRDSFLLVTDFNNNKIKMFEKSGKIQKEWTEDGHHALNYPRAIACNKKGDFAVANKNNNQVLIFDSKFQVKKSIKAPLCQGVVWSSETQLVVTGEKRKAVVIVRENGFVESEITKDKEGNNLFLNPMFAAMTPKGEIVLSDNGKHSLYGLTMGGEVVFKYNGGHMKHPWGVCVDRNGFILVADFHNHHIHLLNQEGEFVCDLVTPADNLRHPQGIAIDNDGNLVVAEWKGKVKIFKYLG